ncbi:nesprin-2-like [Clupea harengus]|uniref:Nesprin-2-like n=1 Tax=Clupea harengus TaxID=7950 RepID=A0A8M1KVV0_CLUHA|nr:nesprin-2-like [Clupea harengus]
MATERAAEEGYVERGSFPLDIDDVQILLQVEQEQIQKRTFTNWINAQLSKRRPPCVVLDLFYDFRDGARLLDLLEAISGQRMGRERGRGMFQHRSNIETALSFLKKKSIKLVNINIPDIIDGKPSIILGLIWTIILHFHIEELASTLSFSSRQASLESLASLDTVASSCSSARSSPLPRRPAPLASALTLALHQRFRVSAKKALLLWVREQCHKAGCTLSVKDFKSSWRSGVVFLAILSALRPDVVDLTLARTRTNRQNLEEAFRTAERELRIPRLLDPADVDVREPDEKSIMTYVAQFLQYSKDMPVSEEDMQVAYMTPPKSLSPINLPSNFTPAISASPYRQTSANQKAQEVTYWLEQAYQELLEGWDSTEGESYAERYHVFQTFIVSFNEQRRPVMPLLTAMKRTSKLSEEQRGLRTAWDSLAEKLREYKTELDLSLPPPLVTVGRWLLRAEAVLADEEEHTHDHRRAAEEAREKVEQLKACLEEMPRHLKMFQMFQNMDEYGGELVPSDKLEEMKRRFTSVRVTAKYHGIKLEYQDQRHTALDLLAQINAKLNTWKRAYISQEAVRVLMQDWHETVGKQELATQLEGVLVKLKQVASKYNSKSALAGEATLVGQQMNKLQADSAVALEAVTTVKGIMGRVLTAFDSFSDLHSSLLAWLEQGNQRAQVTAEVLSEWGSRQVRLNQVGSYLLEVTDPQTSRSLTEELRRVNLHWDEYARGVQLVGGGQPLEQPVVEQQPSPQTLQVLLREATQLLKEPLDIMSTPLRTYRKKLQFMMMKIKDVDMDTLSPSPEFPAETLQKFKQAMPEVLQTLCEAMQVCEELQQSVCGLETRLAELLLWEAEARELYQLLRHTHRRQDPRTKELISRGLQLEGQVVTEEQDLQMMVMAGQKNSPLQYLIASSMQDRIRHSVSQSQEVVGLLSSMGSRRDHSPPKDQPPPKIFIQSKAEVEAPPPAKPPVQSEQSDSAVRPEALPQATPPDEAFGPAPPPPLAQPVPQIIVQEFREEMRVSPPHPHSEEFHAPQRQPQVAPTTLPGEPQSQASVRPKSRTRPQGQAAARGEPLEQTPGVALEQRPPQPPRQPPQTRSQPTSSSLPQQEGHTPEQPLDIKARKAQALQNRPWLQQKAQGGPQAAPAERAEPKTQSEAAARDGAARAAPEASAHGSGPEASAHGSGQIQLQTQQQVKTQPQQPVQSQTQQQVQMQGQQVVFSQTQQQQQQQQQVVFTQTQQQVVSQTQPQTKSHPQPLHASKSQAVIVPTQPPVQRQTQPPVQRQTQAPVQRPVPGQQQQTVTPKPQAQAQTRVPAQPQRMAHPQPAAAQSLPVAPAKAQAMAAAPPQPEAQIRPQSRPQPMLQPQPHAMVQPRLPTPGQPRLMSPGQPRPVSPGQPRLPTPGQPRLPTPGQPQQVSALAATPPQASLSYAPPRGQAVTPLQPKPSSSPIQPRIISMPPPAAARPQAPPVQPQPLGSVAPPRHPAQAPHPPAPAVQPQQWGPLTPEVVAQSYHRPQTQAHTHTHTHTPAQMPPMGQYQPYPQQPVPQALPPPQQWAPMRYPRPQTPSETPVQVGPYAQGYPKATQPGPPPQQQWAPMRPELMPQAYPQPPPGAQMQQLVHAVPPPQPWSPPVRPEALPQGYPRAQTQGYAPPQAQTQGYAPPQAPVPYQTPLLSPHPPPQQWMPVQRPESFPQSSAQVLQPPAPQMVQQQQQQQWVQSPTPIPTHVPAPVHPPTPIPTQGPAPLQTPTTLHMSVPKPAPYQPLTPVQPATHKPPPTTAQAPAQTQPPPQTLTQAPVRPQQWGPPQAQAPLQAPVPQAPQALVPQPQAPVGEQAQPQAGPRVKPPALAQAPPQAYTEAYAKAQALARNGFEEAKHCLQEHILEAITVFRHKQLTEEQASAKEEMLRSLDPEMLQEFLRAAEGMEAFCTPPQLRDMEFFTQSVRTQWEVRVCSPQRASVPTVTVTVTYPLTNLRPHGNGHGHVPPSLTSVPTALTEESELLWSEFAHQCSQCSQVRGQDRGVEQDQVDLALKWREQKTHLQNRVTSLGSALQLVDSTERSISAISDRLDAFIKEPKDITAYTLTNSSTLQDIKDLDESIQAEMDRLSRFDSDPSHLDLRDRAPLTQVVLSHRASLDRLRQQVRKSDAAARALDRFLMSLRSVDQDVGAMQGAPSGDAAVLQDGRAKLALIREGVESLGEKAPQLDRLLEGGHLSVTRGGGAVSCLEMASALLKGLEQADSRLASRQQDLQRTHQTQGLTRRRSTFAGQLRKVLASAERQGLQEPTIPAVQQRIRALQDLEAQLSSLLPELHSLREEEQTEHAQNDTDTLWEETQRAVTDRQEQCSVLMELLKKFQNCRSCLGNTLQRAEHTINEQASYMGRDNLQRLITTVRGIKDELGGLGAKMEEIRAVCRQLQSHLKKIPDCKETPFEGEADALVDTWLDVSEKTDSHMDSLCVGLELWDKQLMLGAELDTWAAAKMAVFAQSHPFHSEEQVMEVKAEIEAQEENIERFHRKTQEIQQLLQTKEEPLELQVMETGLRKRMEQVKELFADTSDVFQELQAVRRHLTQKMADCQASVTKIQSALSALRGAGNTQLQTHTQELCEQLQEQEAQLSSLLKEVGVMASVCGPEALEVLAADTHTLRESITHTHTLLQEAREQGERSLIQRVKDECHAFEEWFQDLQLSVNECFENPERRQEVETALKRLTSFLSSKDGEQKLSLLREQVECSGEERLGSEPQAQLRVLLREQQDELDTFRAHCRDRLALMQEIQQNINSLQEEHDYFRAWLQQREHREPTGDDLSQQHQEFLSHSCRAESFSSLLSSTQRRGLRGDALLTDSQALLERYRSLGTRLEQQAQEHASLLGELQDLSAQLDGSAAWTGELRQGLDSLDTHSSAEERRNRAQAVLSLRSEGDSKLSSLRGRVESVCEREGVLGEERRRALLQALGGAEERWRGALQAAEEVRSQAELQDSLSRELQELSAQQESTLAWVQQQQKGLDSLDKHIPSDHRLSTAQAVLSLRSEGDSKLSSLRGRVESVCEREGVLGEERRRALLQALGGAEERWRGALQAAEEVRSQAELQDSLSRELQELSAQQESTLAWVQQQQKGLDSLDKHTPSDHRLSTAQVRH